MKKFKFFALAVLALAFGLTACKDPNGPTGPVGEIVEDGFYVVGEATAFADLKAKGAADATMSAGRNENAKNELREGMYEKYMLLKGGKPFQLVLKAGSSETAYGATLKEVNLAPDGNSVNDQPNITIQRGVMTENGTLQVPADGLYHIVLDLNKDGKLADKEIIVAPVTWGVRGGMNGWGWTAGEASAFDQKTMTWTWKDQALAAGGEFKFAYGGGWKIQLNEMPEGTAADDPGYIKANTNLGNDMINGGDNIKVEKAGTYDITLTYNIKSGEIKDSYTMEITLTKEDETPTECYMIGDGIAGWDWAQSVAMIPVINTSGSFWAIRYIEADKGFKFSTINTDWGSDFTGKGTDTGYEVRDNNCFVAENGLYMIYVDLVDNKVAVEPAAVYGIGDAFGGWDAKNEAAKFALDADGRTVSATTIADGNLRIYVESSIAKSDWWTREFYLNDGVIEYRALVGEQGGPAVTAGQVITLDFNNNTGSIK